jgi:pimeloyl-ACP methyl ester carboxylesterase
VRRLVILLTLVAVGITTAACPSSSSSKAVPAPKGLPSFYAVPSGVADKSPGDLVKSEVVAAPSVHGTVHRVMYVSSDAHSKPAAVTGVVYVPAAPPPPDGYPVVSWAHGTNGMAPKCAPSLDPTTVLSTAAVNALLGLGWEVVATDYQGEGTPPGLLPFLVGDVAGRNALDIVLAARNLPNAHVSTDYIVWGHSQGGQSALFAWKLAPTYEERSGVQMVGAVADAPPSDLATIYQSLSGSPNRVYDYMMLAGFNAGYGNRAAPLDAVLTKRGTALLPSLRQGCLASVTAKVNAFPSLSQLVKTNPFDVPAWRRLFTENDPASFNFATRVPLLIVHGGADEVIPVTTSAQLADHLCALGGTVERWVYPDQSHGGALFVSALDMGRWMLNRFQGSSDSVKPTGEPGVQVHTCR